MDPRYVEILTSFPMLEGYTAHGMELLFHRGHFRELAPGDLLFHEGEPATCVALVVSGRLDLFVNRAGRELPLHVAGPSRLLGELAVLAGVNRLMSARAAAPTTVLEWDADAFRRLIGSDPQLSERIFRETYRSLVEDKESLISALSAVQR